MIDVINPINQNKRNIPRKPKTTTNGIHNGEVTHHQDQSIVFVSLSIKNTINKNVPKPTPLELTSFLSLIL